MAFYCWDPFCKLPSIVEDAITEVLYGIKPGSDSPAQKEIQISKKKSKCQKGRCCHFCKKNGEIEKIYRSHNMRSRHGLVECPALRQFICPRCLATGDNAHTIKYCPL